MSLTIRPCQAADAEAATLVAHAAKRHWGYPDELIHLWAPALTLTPAFVDGADAFVAVEGGEVVGVCAIVGEEVERELEHMWVLPSRIGRGIGRALLRHATRVVRARGARRLRIVSDPNAEAFYVRLGARRTGVWASTPPGRELPVLRLDLIRPADGIAGRRGRPGRRDDRSRQRPPPPTRSR